MGDDETSKLSEARADLTERAPTSVADDSSKYDAFVSYSHAADGKLAPSLRNGLLRFGTPWGPLRWTNPVRSLRVFQDQASLSANPALWPTIEHALGSAEWFILLASPEAANSPWVEKEIDFWRLHKSPERLLIVQTDGDIAWDHDKNDFDWAKTTAMPRRLSTVFADEPRWIDARWARTGAQASVRDPRFRDLVAELAAPLRGVPKDELIGEDIRQHRRLNRWRNAALGIVTVLLIGAVAAAAIAVQQRQTAMAQRDQALRNESRALAGLAENEVERGSQATAVRLALAALPMRLDSPDRAYARVAEGAILYSMQHLRERRRFLHDDSVESVAFSPDGRTLATGSWDKTARLWEVVSGTEIATLRGHEKELKSVAFNPDGRTLATGSTDETARLWQVATGKAIGVLRGHEGDVTSVAFSPDGRTLATGSNDNTARLWEVASGQAIGVRRGHEKEVKSVAFSPDGRTLATGSAVGTARRREVATGKEIGVLRGHEGPVWSVAFSPDGRTLATTGSLDSTARLWEVATSKEIGVLRGHEGPVSSVAFSPDGRTLATGSYDNTTRLWEVATGKEIGVLRGHEPGAMLSVAFSPDGRTLATGSTVGTARLWEVASGTEIGVLRGHEGAVSSVAFSPDGRTLATGSADQTARLWPLGQRVIDLACARVHELPLSENDKQRFGIEDEWCTPEVSAALRAKLGLDEPETSAASAAAAR